MVNFFQFLIHHHPNWAQIRTHSAFLLDLLHINVLPMETQQSLGKGRMHEGQTGEGEADGHLCSKPTFPAQTVIQWLRSPSTVKWICPKSILILPNWNVNLFIHCIIYYKYLNLDLSYLQWFCLHTALLLFIFAFWSAQERELHEEELTQRKEIHNITLSGWLTKGKFIIWGFAIL